MIHIPSLRCLALALILAASLPGCTSTPAAKHSGLRQALTFYASFDHGPDADFGAGDRKLYQSPSMGHPRTGTPGLPASGAVQLAAGQGRFGTALHFTRKTSEMVFFRAKENLLHQTNAWSGTVSLWLRTGAREDLAPGYCDPIQITPRDWNDAAFFVEFEKRTNDVPFRLGVYPDLKVWNPENRNWDSIPASEKPLLTIPTPPISRDAWMHVVFTWENFNTGRPDGIARLFLNGLPAGNLPTRTSTFTWDIDKTLLMLGLNYVGYWDELSVFNRALTDTEIRSLHGLEKGVASLIGH